MAAKLDFKVARTTSSRTAKYGTPFAKRRTTKMGGSTEKRSSIKPTKMAGS